MLIAFAIALLIGGAVFIGGREPTSRSQIVGLFEDQDAAAIADLVVLESLPGVTQDQILQALDGAFRSGDTIETQRSVQAQGRRLTEIVTANGLRLCERPDGGLLINCRLGQVLYEPSGGPEGVTVDFAGAELFPDEGRMQVVLVAPGDEAVGLAGDFALSDPDGSIEVVAEVSELGPFGVGPPVDGDVQIPAGGAVLLLLTVEEDDFARLTQGELTLEIDGAPVTLTVSEAQSYLSSG